MIEDIQEFAERRAIEIRRALGIDSCKWADAQTVLCRIRDILPGVSWKRVKDSELPNALAQWDSASKIISIRETIYQEANFPTQNGRARWAIFHEVVHAMEGHEGVLNRSPSRKNLPKYAKRLKQIEETTDRITAAVIAPRRFISSTDTAENISEEFGLSLEASKFRILEIREERKTPREVPNYVIDLLGELRGEASEDNTRKYNLQRKCPHCGEQTLIPIAQKFLCDYCNNVCD